MTVSINSALISGMSQLLHHSIRLTRVMPVTSIGFTGERNPELHFKQHQLAVLTLLRKFILLLVDIFPSDPFPYSVKLCSSFISRCRQLCLRKFRRFHEGSFLLGSLLDTTYFKTSSSRPWVIPLHVSCLPGHNYNSCHCDCL